MCVLKKTVKSLKLGCMVQMMASMLRKCRAFSSKLIIWLPRVLWIAQIFCHSDAVQISTDGGGEES